MVDKKLYRMNEKEITQGKIKVDVYRNLEETMKSMANQMCDEIIERNSSGEKTLMILPVGPVMQYGFFVERVNSENISLKNVTFLNMDEYMANEKELVSDTDPISFRLFMNQTVYSKIKPELLNSPSMRVFPSLTNREEIEKLVADHGGVDICFGGIGINGHMAFNEPPLDGQQRDESFDSSSVRVVEIARETKVVNAMGKEFYGDFDQVPSYAVTIGLKQILCAKKIRLFCLKEWHRSCVIRASFGECTSKFPASLLQEHKDASIGIPMELAKG